MVEKYDQYFLYHLAKAFSHIPHYRWAPKELIIEDRAFPMGSYNSGYKLTDQPPWIVEAVRSYEWKHKQMANQASAIRVIRKAGSYLYKQKAWDFLQFSWTHELGGNWDKLVNRATGYNVKHVRNFIKDFRDNFYMKIKDDTERDYVNKALQEYISQYEGGGLDVNEHFSW